MSLSAHLPDDGLPKLFKIGLKPLGDDNWFDVDACLPAYLDEKERLAKTRFADIFMAAPRTEAAQREILNLLADHLVQRFPTIYHRDGPMIHILPAGRKIALDSSRTPPLWTAARLVQDDLVLMRKDGDGWRLVAAALCFPSSWNLHDKVSRPINTIHQSVPAFGPATRNAMLIDRMLDHLRPETPMLRWNWSFYSDDALFHPPGETNNTPRFGTGERAENVFLRVERQTLRRLPASGDILFTIRVYIHPLAELERQPNAAQIAAGLMAQINVLNTEQLTYKGFVLDRDRLLKRLGDIAEAGA